MLHQHRHWVLAGLIGVGLSLPGEAADRSHEFSNFSKIHASRGLQVTVVEGPYAVKAEASRRTLLNRIEISQRGDTLHVRQRKGWSFFMMGLFDRTEVTVSLPNLTALSASSGAEIEAEIGDAARLRINASSGSQIDLAGGQFEVLDVNVSSGGDIQIAGRCDTLLGQASSGGSIDAEDTPCRTATLRASSGADIEAAVSETLDAAVSSGGDIEIDGAPTLTRLRESSGGAVDLKG